VIKDNESLLLKLRDTLKLEAHPAKRMRLQQAADELSFAAYEFNDHYTVANLTRLNGAWAHGMRVLSEVINSGPKPSGAGGAMREGAKLAA
jgi:hypothetical protein